MIDNVASAGDESIPAGVTASRLTRVDLLLWVALCTGLLLLRAYPGFIPALSPDSFQYLSAAQNMLQGSFGYTSLIHFDAERSFGVVPAPMVTFGLGYPLVIALVSLAGVTPQTAAMIVSATSTVACVPVLGWIGRQMGFSRLICNVVVACFVFNGAVLEFGDAALSEALFALCMLLGLAMLLHAGTWGQRASWLRWAAAGIAFAAAYFVRYAGLFFIAGLAVLAARHLLARDRERARGHAIALSVALIGVLTVVARNLMLVGNWRGRDEMLVNNAVLPALIHTGQAFNALLLGSGTGANVLGGTFVPKALFVVLALAGLAMLAWPRARDRKVGSVRWPEQLRMGIDTLMLAAVYVACMFFAGLISSISYGSARNFVPITSLLMLLLGWGLQTVLSSSQLSPGLRRSALIALAASFCLYAYLNMLVLRRPPSDAAASVRAQMDAIVGDGKATRAVISELVGPNGVIVANNGQAVGHVLGLRTISLVKPEFSTVTWDERTMHEAVRRFNAGAIVISTPIPEQPGDDTLPSEFIRRLAQGETPIWLRLALRSSRVLVYVPESSGP